MFLVLLRKVGSILTLNKTIMSDLWTPSAFTHTALLSVTFCCTHLAALWIRLVEQVSRNSLNSSLARVASGGIAISWDTQGDSHTVIQSYCHTVI